MPPRYLKLLFLSCVLTLALSAAINAVVDPYGFYRWMDSEGFNHRKPKAGPNGQLAKPYRVLEVRPATLLLGNSRVEVGMDPESPQWPAELRPVFNMALPGTGIDTSLRSLRHVAGGGSLKMVVIGIDFPDFLVDLPRKPGEAHQRSDFEKRLLFMDDGSPNRSRTPQRIKDQATVLLSLNTLIDSLETVALQRFEEQSDLTMLGFNPMREYRRFVRVDGHHTLFRQAVTPYLTSYLREPGAIYDGRGNSSAELEELRAIVRLCRDSGIRLILFTHPVHAQMLEGYRVAGLWTLFEDWKRAVTRIVEDENARGSAAPAELWDFSHYGDIASERIPSASERGVPMRWYWEAGHYKRELGELVLSRVLNGSTLAGAVPQDFGVRLTGHNVEAHLNAMRVRQAAYEEMQAEEVRELAKLAGQIRARLAMHAESTAGKTKPVSPERSAHPDSR